jgi:transposase-like protein
MGMFFVYECPDCGYEYEGAGGKSHGMMSIVHDTYNCKDCKLTFDFYVDLDRLERASFSVPIPRTFWDKLFFREQKFLQHFVDVKISNEDIICKYCGHNNVEVWNSKYPHCSGEMKTKSIGGMCD